MVRVSSSTQGTSRVKAIGTKQQLRSQRESTGAAGTPTASPEGYRSPCSYPPLRALDRRAQVLRALNHTGAEDRSCGSHEADALASGIADPSPYGRRFLDPLFEIADATTSAT